MKGLAAFIVGVAIGVVATFSCAKRYFQKVADAEIESVRNFYSKKREAEPDETSEHEEAPAEREEYKAAATMYSEPEKSTPEIIDPRDFGGSRLAVTYTLYSDGVIADEMDDIVEDVENVLGTEWQNVLKYTDCVYIRNKARFCDYEVVKDTDGYYETHPEAEVK